MKCERCGKDAEDWTSDNCLSDPTPKLTAEEKTRAELIAHREKAIGNYWCWQGDAEDHPESLTCPVLVPADQVREWVASRSKAFEEAYEQSLLTSDLTRLRRWLREQTRAKVEG